MKKSTLIMIIVLGFVTIIVGTPEKAIFYVLLAIWILVLALSIK